MNQNPTDFFSAMEKISRENDKALRSLFGKYIKGNFLIEMKHFIMDNLPEIYNYYDMQMSMEKVVAGNELMDFDICRMIVSDSNHYRLIYKGNDKYVITLHKTPSDVRSGKNLVSDILNTISVYR